MQGKHYRCWTHEGKQALAPLGLGEHLLASTVGPWQLGNCSLETNVHLAWWAQKQGFFSVLVLLSKLKEALARMETQCKVSLASQEGQ